MHWLADFIFELSVAFLPGRSHDHDRSAVGESRMDRQARWVGYGILVIIIGAVIFFTL